jgi:nucleotide-binding universal stress UspA family protein
MTFKDILVHANADKGMTARSRIAIELAQRYEAHLTGVCFADNPAIPVTKLGMARLSLLESQHEAAVERANAAAGNLRAAATKAGLISDCRVIECTEGDVARLLSLHGRHADLVVLGQPDREGMAADGPSLPATVTLDCGRPVIVVPHIGTAATIGERVLVAWDGGREAVRAVNDALPILRRAKSVTVLSVNPAESEDDGPREPGADISLHLARHGVMVEAQSRFTTEISAGDVILNEVANKGSDLLVMGAYGHSRLRELVLGGVTRHILASMTIPVLMSH